MFSTFFILRAIINLRLAMDEYKEWKKEQEILKKGENYYDDTTRL